jgi:hypothetical protein
MHYRNTLPIVVITLCSLALSSDLQRQDQLVWDFAEFVEAFSTKNWRGIDRFIGPQTKAGLGGEMGMEGILQVFDGDDGCHDSMVRALELGCRKTGDGEEMRCISPPQLGPEVVYLGARASFKYDVEGEIWMVEVFICGGD